jgi:ATP-binding protein involved in chromosome partitioning
VRAVNGVTDVAIAVGANVRAVTAPEHGGPPLAGVKNVIAVGAGKGGVGKTTVSVNLALALAQMGCRVGILDGDVYGPNVPLMFGLSAELGTDGQKIAPAEKYGVQVVSMAFLAKDDQALIWRGPMLHSAIQQFFRDVAWTDLDYLIVDMPPGTGDIQLTLSQRVPMTGAVIVTTPQDIALLDARKALKMFEKVEVPVLGVVENMAVHICSNCGHAEHLFGEGGGAKLAAQYGVEVLASLPLSMLIREQADSGKPTAIAEPESQIAMVYQELARHVGARIVQQEAAAPAMPNITISED